MAKIILSLLLFCYSGFIHAYSPAWILVDMDSGKVISLNDDGGPRPIASITKVMGALITMRGGLDGRELVKITGTEFSRNLYAGMMVERQHLIELSLVSSDNLAARTLAESWPDGYASFIDKMNETARELGMTNTVYVDATGIASTNRSTVNDLAKLVNATTNFPLFTVAANARQIMIDAKVRIKNGFTSTRFTGKNTNPYVGQLDIIAAKTGYTSAAGRCLTMLFKYDGRTYYLTVLGASSAEHRRKLVDNLIALIK